MSNHDRTNSATDPKKIYFVWDYLEWGGVQIYFLGLMRSVSEKYRVKVILPVGSDEKLLRYLEADQIEYEFFEGRIEKIKVTNVWQRIRRRWVHFRIDLLLAGHFSKIDLTNSIIQIDVAPWAGFALLLYLTLRTDVFVTFHTALPHLSFLRRLWLRLKFGILCAFERFHVVASNHDVKKSLRPFVGKSRYDGIEIVYSSVNMAEIEKATAIDQTRFAIAERYHFPPEKKWVCSVAQFIERKGCWVFLEAAKILRQERDDLFFFWLGTAPLPEEIKARIGEYDLGDDFRFLSAEEIGDGRSDLLTLWKAADLFVLPSFQEGLPVALVEAMALGKACICSNVNAIPEAVKHLETGYLVAAGNGAELASAIGALADDAELSKRLGANARKSVQEHFEEKVSGRKMLKLYGQIV